MTWTVTHVLDIVEEKQWRYPSSHISYILVIKEERDATLLPINDKSKLKIDKWSSQYRCQWCRRKRAHADKKSSKNLTPNWQVVVWPRWLRPPVSGGLMPEKWEIWLNAIPAQVLLTYYNIGQIVQEKWEIWPAIPAHALLTYYNITYWSNSAGEMACYPSSPITQQIRDVIANKPQFQTQNWQVVLLWSDHWY